MDPGQLQGLGCEELLRDAGQGMKKVGTKNTGSRVWGALSPLGRRSEGRQWVQRNRVGSLQSESSWRKESDSVSGKGMMTEIPTKQMDTMSP